LVGGLSAKTDGSGYGQPDRRNHGAKPVSSDRQRGGFANGPDVSMGDQLPEAGARSIRHRWLHGWQRIVREPCQSFVAGCRGRPTTVEASMLIQKAGEKLLRSGLGGGVGGSPDLLAVLPDTHPIGRIAHVDGRHWPVPTSW